MKGDKTPTVRGERVKIPLLPYRVGKRSRMMVMKNYLFFRFRYFCLKFKFISLGEFVPIPSQNSQKLPQDAYSDPSLYVPNVKS